MEKLLVSVFIGFVLTACGVDDVAKAIQSAAQKAAFQERAERAFGGAVTEVTKAALSHVRIAMYSAPLAPVVPLAVESEPAEPVVSEVEIFLGEELKHGGRITLSGTLTVTTTTEAEVVDRVIGGRIRNKYTSVRMTLDSGEQLALSGEQVILGTVHSVRSLNASTDTTFELDWNLKGEFNLDGKPVLYDVSLTHDGGDLLNYAGTLNGNQVEGALDLGKEKAPPNVFAGACYLSTKSCTEYFGYSYSPWSDATCRGGAYPVDSCATEANFTATCTFDKGTATERVIYTTELDQYMGCTNDGGIYETL